MSWEGIARGVALISGLAMIVAAISQDQSRDGFAVVLLLSGVGVVVAALALPRLREMEVGPQKVRAVLDPEGQATAEIANDEPAELKTTAESLDDEGAVPASRALLAWWAIDVLRRPDTGPLVGCTIQLYLYDADVDRLVAVRAPGIEPGSESWEIGKGVTGAAYETGEYVLAEGDAVWDETYGLSEEQQERYRGIAAVAAMPVVNAVEEVVAVLTTSTNVSQSPMTSQEGFEDQLVRSQLVARVLVDLLKWFGDG